MKKFQLTISLDIGLEGEEKFVEIGKTIIPFKSNEDQEKFVKKQNELGPHRIAEKLGFKDLLISEARDLVSEKIKEDIDTVTIVILKMMGTPVNLSYELEYNSLDYIPWAQTIFKHTKLCYKYELLPD
jgi:hypothetical protein